jgi:acyl-CoA thioester hydrolase
MKVRIYYHHTDCGGVVYYANYLKFLEEARTEFLEEKGVHIKDLSSRGILFVVARQEIDYKAPAFYGDILDVRAKVTGHSSVKLEFEQEIKNQTGQLISKAKTILVCIDKNFKPQGIPEDIKGKICLTATK